MELHRELAVLLLKGGEQMNAEHLRDSWERQHDEAHLLWLVRMLSSVRLILEC